MSEARKDVPLSTTFNRMCDFVDAKRAEIADIRERASPSADPVATVNTTGFAR
ncbi:hypothetical protein [Bradyrhizobium australiense]|uniref:hypothetical protein n=1 Tax=Bradyrhizobium australiense TaxID=2721161 RepID=UPI001F28EB76|nr:hypothetical protein [Bradyrhizobium australiense]